MTSRRRRRSRPIIVLILIGLIGGAVYLNQFVVPTVDPLFIPTPTPTRSPESFVNEAQQAFNNGNLTLAINLYTQAIIADSTNPSIYFDLARVQLFAEEYEEALENAENGLLLSENNAQGRALRAYALLQTDDLLLAEAEASAAIELDPLNPFGHAAMAEIMASQGDLEQAAESSRNAVELAPNLIEARRARGIVLSVTGNYQEAVNEYQRALDLNNNIAGLHFSLGLNYRVLGEYDLAVQEFTRANALNPSDPDPETWIANTYLVIGQFAKAVQFAERAVQDDPSDPALHGNLGYLYYKNEQYGAAIESLRLAVQGGQADTGEVMQGIPLESGRIAQQYYSAYGLALARANRCAEAVQVFNAILTGVPEDETAVFNANLGIDICQDNLEEAPPTPPSATDVAPTGEEG